jgi:hypothetical protein
MLRRQSDIGMLMPLPIDLHLRPRLQKRRPDVRWIVELFAGRPDCIVVFHTFIQHRTTDIRSKVTGLKNDWNR